MLAKLFKANKKYTVYMNEGVQIYRVSIEL